MTYTKVSLKSYKVADKWLAFGVLWIHDGNIDKDIKLGPSEPKFDSKEEADRYVHFLAKKSYKN